MILTFYQPISSRYWFKDVVKLTLDGVGGYNVKFKARFSQLKA